MPNKSALYGGEKGIRTPGTVITVHMISNHAPSASSDISPTTANHYIKVQKKNQALFVKTNFIIQNYANNA